MKRPLASAGFIFIGALALLVRVPAQASGLCALFAFTLLGASYWFLNNKARAAVLCALCSLFAAAFCAHGACLVRDAQCALLSGRTHETELVVREVNESYATPLVSADVISVSKRRTLGVTTEFFSNDGLAAGDELRAIYEFDPIVPPSRSGELATGGTLVAIIRRSGQRSDLRIMSQLRRYITRSIERTLAAGEIAGLCAAVTTGERSSVSAELRDAMNRAGDSHLLAVSGLHITLLLGTLLSLLAMLRPRAAVGAPVAALLSAACIAFYGGTPSVTRAAVMALFTFSGALFERRNDPLTSMSAAAIVILLLQPLAVCDASFLLSFSCCFAIVAVFPKIDAAILRRAAGARAWVKAPIYVLRALALSATISVVTLPVVIALGFPLSLVSPLVNVPVIALTPFMLGASFLMPVFALAGFLEPLRMASGLVAGLTAKAIISISYCAASLPRAAVSTGAAWLKIWAAACCALAAANYISRRRGRFRLRALVSATACAVALAVGLIATAAANAGVPRLYTYGGVAVVDGSDGAVVAVKTMSVNGADYLKGYLAQRNSGEVAALIVTDYLSDEKLAALTSATGCETVYRLGEGGEPVELYLGDVIVRAEPSGDIAVFTPGGAALAASEPRGAFDNGFHVSAIGIDGEAELLCDGGADYHSADITVYLSGENGYRRVSE